MGPQKFSRHHSTSLDIALPRIEVLVVVTDKIDNGNMAAVFTVRRSIRPCKRERSYLSRIVGPPQRHTQHHHSQGPYQERHVTGGDGVLAAWHEEASTIAAQAQVAASVQWDAHWLALRAATAR